jgi:hypothetical protein
MDAYPIKFCVYADEDTEYANPSSSYIEGLMNIIVFGNEIDIRCDRIQGGGYENEYHRYNSEDPDDEDEGEYICSIPDDMDALQELFDDTCMLCEDYLIHTAVPITMVRAELESRGYVYDERLKDIGWA